MPRVVSPRCSLCGGTDRVRTCPQCDAWFCRDCMGPHGECKHEQYEPLRSNVDWVVK